MLLLFIKYECERLEWWTNEHTMKPSIHIFNRYYDCCFHFAFYDQSTSPAASSNFLFPLCLPSPPPSHPLSVSSYGVFFFGHRLFKLVCYSMGSIWLFCVLYVLLHAHIVLFIECILHTTVIHSWLPAIMLLLFIRKSLEKKHIWNWLRTIEYFSCKNKKWLRQ